MKSKQIILCLLAVINVVFVNHALSQTELGWVKQIGSTNYDIIEKVLYSNDGYLFISGYFYGSLDIDPGPGITMLYNEDEACSSFVAKFDTSGNFIWVKQLIDTHVGEEGLPMILDITQDKHGNILLTGAINDSTYFDYGNSGFCLCPEGEEAGFLWVLDPDGNFLNALKFDGIGYCFPTIITIDKSNNILLTGNFHSEIDFDPGTGIALLNAPEFSNNVFICKLDSTGEFIWVKQFENNLFDATDDGSSIAIDNQNNIYIGGHFHGMADFDPGVGNFYLTGDYYNGDGFICRLDSSGSFINAMQIGGDGATFITKLLITSDSSMIYSGIYRGTCCFDTTGTNCLHSLKYEYNSFVCEMKFDGTIIWLKELRADQMIGVYINDIIMNDEAYYVAGIFDNNTDFDPGPDKYLLQSNGGWDLFIGKYDSAFNLVWINHFGSPAEDMVISFQVDNDHHIYSAGSFESTLDFDPGYGVCNLSSNGADDGFLFKLNEILMTKISSNDFYQTMIVFPNPAKGFFRVQFQQVSQKSLLQFVDMTGRKVKEISIAPFLSSEAVNCSHWPPGVYFGQLICDGRVVAKCKVAVK